MTRRSFVGLVLGLALAVTAPTGRAPGASHALCTPSGVHARFADGAAALTMASHTVTIGFSAIGRGAVLDALDPASAQIAPDEMRYLRSAHPELIEWWRDVAGGLEHGLTIGTRPPGTGALGLEVSVDGLSAGARSDRDVVLRDAAGREVARYAELTVIDATGARIPAAMHGHGDRVRIEIDDEGARYPLIVDPLVAMFEATLTTAAIGEGSSSVAMSSDASRVLIGVFDDSSTGAAYVFVRSGTSWSLETRLVSSDAVAGDSLGLSVALSGDGTIALVGAPGDDVGGATDAGSVRTFVRGASGWSPGPTLTDTTPVAGDQLGVLVAIAADGSRLAASSVAHVGERVFVSAGSAWTYETTLVPTAITDSSQLGPVALDGDGTHVVVGAPLASAGMGAAWMFERTGSSWSQRGQWTADPAFGGQQFGSAVAITGDAQRVVIGAPFATGGGHVYFYDRSTDLTFPFPWLLESSLAPPTSGFGGATLFGASVAISSDGVRAFVAAPQSAFQGQIALYDRTAVGAPAGMFRWEYGTFVARMPTSGTYFGLGIACDVAGTRLVGVSPGNTGMNGATTGTVFRVTGGVANACSTAADCAAGFCDDGVCCATDCGTSTTDCQACSAALTGGTDGTCGALSLGVATAVTCRAVAGACDVAETCQAGMATCPPDIVRGAEQCRGSMGPCDVAEFCDGAHAACPVDAFVPSTTTCRAAVDVCDAAETCTGATAACPNDAQAPSSTECRAASGVCDSAEHCTGSTTSCPADTFLAAGTVCAPTGGDACDAPDVCSGMSAACVPTFATGVVCRPAVGACDVAESCSGTATSCPPDGVLASGVTCRMSTAAGCDPGEACDGVSTSCPLDVNTCPASDAGVSTDAGAVRDAGDASSGHDGALAVDAATSTPPPAAGCSCHTARSHGAGPTLALVTLALAFLRRSARSGSTRRRA